ncbi:MAG TPA: hypothetical protein VF292_02520 [Rhodanobacteraceae bacterium]
MANSDPSGTREHQWAIGIVFLITIFLLLLRSPQGTLTTPQFFAEDGTIFFQQQFGKLWPQIFTPYAGYIHCVPRLIAYIASLFSYKHQPFIYNLSATLIDAGAITYFASRMRRILPIWITISIFVFMPSDGEEYGHLLNIQWFLQFALLAAVLWPKSTTITKCREYLYSVVVLLISITGPFSIFCLIIFALLCSAKLVTAYAQPNGNLNDTLKQWWIHIHPSYIVSLCIGSGVQLFFIATTPSRHLGFNLVDAKLIFFEGFQFKLFGTYLFPYELFGIFIIASIVLLITHVYRHPNVSGLIILALIPFAVIQLVGLSDNYGVSWLAIPTSMAGDRYYFFAKVAFWVCLGFALSGGTSSKHYKSQILVPVSLMFIAILNPQYLRNPAMINMHWTHSAQLIRDRSTDRPLVIPINPPGWHVTLPPARVRSGTR